MASYLDYRYLRFTQTIRLMIITLTVSLILVILGFFHVGDLTPAAVFVRSIDFNEAFLHGMLVQGLTVEHVIRTRTSAKISGS